MTEISEPGPDRRPIATRNVRIVQRCASWIARTGVTPNAISVSSMFFGAAAGLCLAATSLIDGPLLRGAWIGAAVFMQLRLLANMFDGMVALETGKDSAVGEIFNEAPDRASDVAVLVGAGYALGGCPVLGFTAALAALGVAYVRALGASAGAGQVFAGPMAKPQRMFVLTLAAIYCSVTPHAWQPTESTTGWSIVGFTLLSIVVGSTITLLRRLVLIARALKSTSPERSS